MADKASLRRRYAALRDTIPSTERAVAESAIRDKLFSLPAWQRAPLVCGYASVRSEISMLPIWEKAASDGKDYALPVTITDARDGRMIFRRLPDFCPESLLSARFGIPEPSEACPSLKPQDLTGALILVPGLAFDDSGFRIGYGGGYYDRFLTELRKARIPVTTVGLAFSACRTSILPHEPHDIPVDYILDERRITPTHGI